MLKSMAEAFSRAFKMLKNMTFGPLAGPQGDVETEAKGCIFQYFLGSGNALAMDFNISLGTWQMLMRE